MRVLITGMSGTGKSTLVGELRSRGQLAYDADDDGFSEPREDGRWGWRADAVERLLSDATGTIYFAGCSEEQAAIYFDLRVLLTAPRPVIVERLAGRGETGYGGSARERDQVLADLEEIEPLLRRSADLVLSTDEQVDRTVEAVFDFVAAGRGSDAQA